MLPISKESMRFAMDKLDTAIEILLPRMTEAEFMRIVKERYDKMDDSYQDYLSRPQA